MRQALFGSWNLRDSGIALAAFFLAERERWALWAPVFVGTGIAIYFALPWEPAVWAGPVLLVGALFACLVRSRSVLATLLAFGVALSALGFTVAHLRAQFVAAPVLERPYGPAPVSGRVRHVELFPKGPRVLLDQVTLGRLSPERTPELVRIRLHADDRPAVGSRISVYAKLMPPGEPSAPGTYDFQRHAWFAKIGAVGFAFGQGKRIAGEPSNEGGSIALWIAAVRQQVTTRIRAAAPGEAGAIAAALVTGDRSGISRDTMAAMRDSGLAHLLAISGLHMGLVAAILFFGLRTLLACSERLALRYPIKKGAAAVALLGGFAYLVLAGATIPTQRAFLMTGFVLVAVLLDRIAISLRLVAWAATVILLISPESLLSASFQMSFAAVVALVALYEDGWRAWKKTGVESWLGKLSLYMGGVATTTIVAGAATGIFAMYHFGRIAHFGVAANLLAVPITAFWIMPWAVIAMILMPFGLEALAFVPMTWGIDAVVGVAGVVAGWPGAVGHTPAMPVEGLAVAAFGGLWLCLWRRKWRYAGLVGIVAGVASISLYAVPDILVSGDGRLMAVLDQDGALLLSTKRRERRTASAWLRRAGQHDANAWRSSAAVIRCDGLACSYETKGRMVALVNDARALLEDCRRANIVISAIPVRSRCPSARLVVDRFDLWRKGAHAIWFDREGLKVATVAGTQGERLWTRKRPPWKRKRINSGAVVQSVFLAP